MHIFFKCKFKNNFQSNDIVLDQLSVMVAVTKANFSTFINHSTKKGFKHSLLQSLSMQKHQQVDYSQVE